jgi:hypothetical protein
MDDLNAVVVGVPILAILAIVFLIVLALQGRKNKSSNTLFRQCPENGTHAV